MDGVDANDTRPDCPVVDAAVALRPAFVLWLIVLAAVGASWLAARLAADRLPDDSELPAGFGVAGNTLAYLAIAVFATRDRLACRVFAAPRNGVAVLSLLVGVAAATALAWLEARVFGTPPLHVESLGSHPRVLGAMLTGALLPAVFEELMFRGVILGRLRQVFSPGLAVAVQAAMFAAMHGSSLHLLPHLAFGCVAGFLRVAAGALWPCMLMHFCWNGWLVLERYGWL